MLQNYNLMNYSHQIISKCIGFVSHYISVINMNVKSSFSVLLNLILCFNRSCC